MSTQEVYTAKLALASEDDEGGSGHNESSPLSLVAYSLTLSAQALFHAPMLYYRITRLLLEHGCMCCPDGQGARVLLLVPQAWSNDKGLQRLLTPLLPLLPRQSSSVKAHSRFARDWTLLLRPLAEGAASGGDGQKNLQLGQPSEWHIQLVVAKRAGADELADEHIQACVAYALRLELIRRGWSYADGRWLRLPPGLRSSICASFRLSLSLTHQRQLTLCVLPHAVRFAPLDAGTSSAVEELSLVERMVRVMPECDEGVISRVCGVADEKNSLGVDRESWLEKHGVTLPPRFVVVQVTLAPDDWRSTVSTMPLPCCLEGAGLVNVASRAREDVARATERDAATIDELLSSLRSLRVADPSGSGSLVPLLENLQKQEADPLLAALNPLKRATPADTLRSDVGFMPASAALLDRDMQSALQHASGKKPKVQLTLGSKRKSTSSALSLQALKTRTQLPPGALSLNSGGGGGGGFGVGGGGIFASLSSGGGGISSSSGGGGWASGSSSQRPKESADKGESEKDSAAATKTKAPSVILKPSTPAKRKEAPAPATTAASAKKISSKSSAAKTDSVQPAPAKKAKSSSSTSTSASGSSKAKSSSSGGSSKSKKAASGSVPSLLRDAEWVGDFRAAFEQQLSEEVIASAAAFRKAMGDGPVAAAAPTSDAAAAAVSLNPAAAATPSTAAPTAAAAAPKPKASAKAASGAKASKAATNKANKKGGVQTKLNFAPA